MFCRAHGLHRTPANPPHTGRRASVRRLAEGCTTQDTRAAPVPQRRQNLGGQWTFEPLYRTMRQRNHTPQGLAPYPRPSREDDGDATYRNKAFLLCLMVLLVLALAELVSPLKQAGLVFSSKNSEHPLAAANASKVLERDQSSVDTLGFNGLKCDRILLYVTDLLP